MIRRSQVAHGDRAQCELHDNGPVVPIGNHRQDVPSVRFGGPDDAHLQGVDLRPDKGASQLPASREETFQASSEDGMRTPKPVRGSTRRGRREQQRRFQVVVVGEVNSLSDAPRGRGRGRRGSGRVAPGCTSSAGAPRRRGLGATAFCGWGNPTHGAEPCEPPAS